MLKISTAHPAARAAGLIASGVAALLVATRLSVGEFLPSSAQTPPATCAEAAVNRSILWCDDFDDGGFRDRWDIGGHQGMFPIGQFVLCEDDRFGFGDRCAAWSNHLSFDHEWGFYGYDARRSFAPQPELYIRWYQFISNPYDWGTLEDKSVMLHDESNTLTAYVGTNRDHRPVVRDSGPGMPFVANYQDVDTPETGGLFTRVNRFQNQGRNLTLLPGKWYLFEWYLKLNTPGVSDGITRLWIDDATGPIGLQTLRLQYTDMRWLRHQDRGKPFSVVRLTVYHQRCDGIPFTCPPRGPWIVEQSQRWDRLAISTRPIGPVPGSGPDRAARH